MDFGLGPPFLLSFNQLGGLGKPTEPFFRLSSYAVNFHEYGEKRCSTLGSRP
jgi:hypothetical protein